MHYYKFNIADYRKDTSHLSLIEHAIYRSLIDWYYLDEAPIPLETQSVMRRLRLVSEEEAKALENVLSDFFYVDNGWRHKRIDQDIVEYHAMSEKNKSNGKHGGRPKKTQSVSDGLPGDNPNESQKNPNHKPLTINQVNLKDNTRAPRFDAQAHLVEAGVDPLVASDWITHRKAKKAPITATVIAGITSEAKTAGMALADVLGMCCQRGWTGFKAEWISGDKKINGKTQYQINQDATTRAIFGTVSDFALTEKVITGEVVR